MSPEKTHQDAADQAETSEMPDRNPKPPNQSNLHQFRCPSPQSIKPTKPNTKISEGGRRSCRRCPTSFKTTDRDCSSRITPDLARTKRIGRSNSCRRCLDKTSRPVTRERLPVDGQGRRSIHRCPPSNRESLARGRRRSPSGTTSPPAPVATARNRRRKD